MPIKGLHQNRQSPGLARAGVIRLGFKAHKCQTKSCGEIVEASTAICPKCGKGAWGNEFPREADHFVLTDAPGVAEAIGNERPTELKIYFPFDEVDQVFPNYMQFWQASSLVCRGDGEKIIYAIQPQTGRAIIRDGIALEDFTENKQDYKMGQSMLCPGLERNLYPKCEHCKPNAILVVMLRDIPRLAYYQISTTSIHNIAELPTQLNYVREQVHRLTGEARITGVPFILRRVKRNISVPKTENGKQVGRQRTDKYLLELEIEPEWIMKMIAGLRRLADPMQRFESLPASIDDSIDNPDIVEMRSFTEPPMWEPRDYESDGALSEFEGCSTIDDLLYQIHLDFELSEDEARRRLKLLGYNTFPQNGEAIPRSIEMYNAIRASLDKMNEDSRLF